jgi:hypothetical protein
MEDNIKMDLTERLWRKDKEGGFVVRETAWKMKVLDGR